MGQRGRVKGWTRWDGAGMAKDSYHHGALRAAVLDEAAQMVGRQGVDASPCGSSPAGQVSRTPLRPTTSATGGACSPRWR